MTLPEDDVSVATGAGPLTAAAAVVTELIEEYRGLSSVTGYHLCLVGRRDTGATQYRGGEPAVPCGDAEHVESQRAGGQSVSIEAQVELLFALA